MSPLSVPALGFGCAPLGNLLQERSDQECDAVLQAAWAAGLRHFDTAPHYGLGLSEVRLGRFLATKPRDSFVVSTKVGRLIRPNAAWDGASLDDQGFAVPARFGRVLDYSVGGVRASLEESLSRMGLDRVDILYVHDPERGDTPRAGLDGLEALQSLREEGLVGAIGTGSMVVEALAQAVRSGIPDLIMVAGRYTLLDQTALDAVLPLCAETGTKVVAAAVFNSGLLAGPLKTTSTYDYAAVPPAVFERARAIDAVCAEFGVDLSVAAMQYPRLDSRVVAVVVGAVEPEQARKNVERFNTVVPEALWAALDQRGLVPRCA